MLHIILGILKMIGIILAIFLILLMGIVLAVMLVPWHYKIMMVKKQEEMRVRVRITWLLHLVSVFLAYDPVLHQRIVTVRFFGISLDRIKKGCRRCADRRRRHKKQIKFCKEREKIQDEAFGEETEEQEMMQEELFDKETEEQEMMQDEGFDKETEEKKMTPEESTKKRFNLKNCFSGVAEKYFQMLQWIRKKLQKLCSIPQRVKKAVVTGIDLMKTLLQMPEKAAEKIAEYQKLWNQYEGSEVLGAVKKEGIHLIQCFRPRKIYGYLHFGTGDPAKTGQLLGLMYLLLPVRAEKFVLKPEFTESVFETDVSMCGHIRLNHAIASIWRLMRNKKLIRAIRMLKKERRK